MQLKLMVQYVLYSESIDTTDISRYDTEPYQHYLTPDAVRDKHWDVSLF